VITGLAVECQPVENRLVTGRGIFYRPLVAGNMECERCGATEIRIYRLSGREAGVCTSCGYVGVAVEHRVERREGETWEEAMRRFREEQA
jgi:hypothetical protein